MLPDEETEARPINVYGATKRAIEDMLENFAASHGPEAVILRYFNVAGADPEGRIGGQHRPETHLIPVMLDAIAGRRSGLVLHGTDYPMRDGTSIRDYVQVTDLAEAHVPGLHWLLGGRGGRSFNLGTGTGVSVRQVIEAARVVTNLPVPMTEGPRRGGDAVTLVCGGERARADLGWVPERSTLPQMIRDASARSQRPGHGG